jgi:TRAP transporter 4TM/12TM fusion protein
VTEHHEHKARKTLEEYSGSLTPTANEEEISEFMKQYDPGSAYREHKCWKRYITIAISLAFCAFQLYATLSGAITAQILRASHLAFVMLLAFILYPASRKMPLNTLPLYDVGLALAGFASWAYIVVNFDSLVRRTGANVQLDIAVAVFGIALLFEASRRVSGIPMMLIAGSFIAYAFVGPWLPGFLNHRGYSFERVVTHLYYNTEGIMGTPIGACASFIFLFILFGSFLEKTGIGQFFIDICNAIAGGAAGGPAKVAVLTSALEGTVSGSSVSNTVGSGSFTIPMMKSLGYKGEFAAAVEAAASTGGQIMPPIMGAAAFLMAESLGIPYTSIVKAAIIPALLYFSGIFIMVHLEARKLGLKGLSKESLPKFLPLFLTKGYLMAPLGVIIFFLVEGKTATYSALMGIAACAVLGIVASIVDLARGKRARMGRKDFVEVFTNASRNVVAVAIACGMAGIIIGIVTLTGVGLKLGAGLIAISRGIPIVTLVLTMLSSIILGMGAPTTANYLITSTITAGAIVGLGFEPLAAHMFAFYFGIIADITPPVALAAIAGSAIAKSKPMATALQATKLAIAAFIIPYIFVFNPQMLLIDTNPGEVALIIVTSLIGMVGVGAGLEGWLLRRCNPFERVVLAGAGLMLIVPGPVTDAIGLALISGELAFQFFTRHRR